MRRATNWAVALWVAIGALFLLLAAPYSFGQPPIGAGAPIRGLTIQEVVALANLLITFVGLAAVGAVSQYRLGRLEKTLESLEEKFEKHVLDGEDKARHSGAKEQLVRDLERRIDSLERRAHS